MSLVNPELSLNLNSSLMQGTVLLLLVAGTVSAPMSSKYILFVCDSLRVMTYKWVLLVKVGRCKALSLCCW